MHPKTGQAVQLPKTESCGPALSPWSSPGLGSSPTASPSQNICCAFTCWESNCYSLLLCSPHLLCFYLLRIKLLFFVAVQSSFVVLLPAENQTVILCCCAVLICCAFTCWESNCYSLLLCSPHLLCFYLLRIKWLVVSLLLCSTHKQWESTWYSVFVGVQYSQRGCLSIERGLGLYLVEDFPCIHQHLPQVVHVTPENQNQRIVLIW